MAADPPQSSNKHNTLLVAACLGCTLYKRSVQSTPVQFSPLITDSPSVMPPGHYHIMSSSQASKSANKYYIDLS